MNYLTKFAAMILALSAFALPGQALAAKEMRVGSWLPPKHTMNKDVLPTWGKWISDATEGRVTLKIEYPGGIPRRCWGTFRTAYSMPPGPSTAIFPVVSS